MVFAFPILFVGWKLWHKTKFHKPHEADLYKDLDAIEEYERNYVYKPAEYVTLPLPRSLSMTSANYLYSNWFDRILDKVFG